MQKGDGFIVEITNSRALSEIVSPVSYSQALFGFDLFITELCINMPSQKGLQRHQNKKIQTRCQKNKTRMFISKKKSKAKNVNVNDKQH